MTKPIFLFITLFCLIGHVGAQDIVPLKKIYGTNDQPGLDRLAPKSGVLVGELEWKGLWEAWKVPGRRPQVDFTKQLVIVQTVSGPNRMIIGPLSLDGAGDLSFQVSSTKMGGPGFGYVLIVTSKDRIQSVLGMPVPQAENEMAPEQTAADSINVVVVGTLKTGIMAIGGETTGTTITANGVTWELELQDVKQFEFAKQNANQRVRVTGEFVQFGGVEVPDRSVVLVRTLEPPNKIIEPKLAQRDSPRVIPNTPNNAKPTPGQPDLNVGTWVTPKGVSQPSAQPAPLSSVPSLKPLDNFDQIQLKAKSVKSQVSFTQTLDGAGRLIASDGTQKNISPENLKRIHDIVGFTQWRDVPRVSRTNDGSANIEYEIEIRTKRGATRLFVDDRSTGQVPVVQQIFKLMK